jgi:hypothetical protein
MVKPRLRWVAAWRMWLCVGGGARYTGLGFTAHEAWCDWDSRMRGAVS